MLCNQKNLFHDYAEYISCLNCFNLLIVKKCPKHLKKYEIIFEKRNVFSVIWILLNNLKINNNKYTVVLVIDFKNKNTNIITYYYSIPNSIETYKYIFDINEINNNPIIKKIANLYNIFS